MFTTTRTDKIYCSEPCRRASEYERHDGWRAKARAALTCVECAAPIVGAGRKDKKLCATCKRAHRLANIKRNRERTKAGTTGKRGRNQFSAGAPGDA